MLPWSSPSTPYAVTLPSPSPPVVPLAPAPVQAGHEQLLPAAPSAAMPLSQQSQQFAQPQQQTLLSQQRIFASPMPGGGGVDPTPPTVPLAAPVLPAVPVPAPITLSSTLHFLQTEHRRYARDRNEWEIERAEMRARVALLEGEKRGNEGALRDLGRRCRMLEGALRSERSKVMSLGGGHLPLTTTQPHTPSLSGTSSPMVIPTTTSSPPMPSSTGSGTGAKASASTTAPSALSGNADVEKTAAAREGSTVPSGGETASSSAGALESNVDAAIKPLSSLQNPSISKSINGVSTPALTANALSSAGLHGTHPIGTSSNHASIGGGATGSASGLGHQGSNGLGGGASSLHAMSGVAGTSATTSGRDPRGKARSRDYLKQCLQEITYLTSSSTLNPLAPASFAVPNIPRPKKVLGPVPLPLATPSHATTAPVATATSESTGEVPPKRSALPSGMYSIQLPPSVQPTSSASDDILPAAVESTSIIPASDLAPAGDPPSVFIPLRRKLSAHSTRSLGDPRSDDEQYSRLANESGAEDSKARSQIQAPTTPTPPPALALPTPPPPPLAVAPVPAATLKYATPASDTMPTSAAALANSKANPVSLLSLFDSPPTTSSTIPTSAALEVALLPPVLKDRDDLAGLVMEMDPNRNAIPDTETAVASGLVWEDDKGEITDEPPSEEEEAVLFKGKTQRAAEVTPVGEVVASSKDKNLASAKATASPTKSREVVEQEKNNEGGAEFKKITKTKNENINMSLSKKLA